MSLLVNLAPDVGRWVPDVGAAASLSRGTGVPAGDLLRMWVGDCCSLLMVGLRLDRYRFVLRRDIAGASP